MDVRAHLNEIARAALDRVDPYRMVKEAVRIDGGMLHVAALGENLSLDLRPFERIFVLGFGKASGLMARGALEVLGSRINEGLVVVKPGHELELQGFRQVRGGHPIPDENSVAAAGEVSRLAGEADEKTLVICLISGGGSALLSAPLAAAGRAITLQEIRATTKCLIGCGATISEINCIRKHLLALAGGRLGELISPATTVSLILSDVVGDDLETIASGPTCPDSTTYEQALAIVAYYGIGSSLPAPVVELLRAGARGDLPETPKPGSTTHPPARNLLIGTNLGALLAAREKARALGYNSIILTSRLSGEAREIARALSSIAKEAAATELPCRKPACILSGGETTVTLQGSGKGGRNQEMALAFLWEIEKEPSLLERACLLSFATDGEDGPTEAAGGFAEAAMLGRARSGSLRIADYLRNNDSNSFLSATDGLFVTGPTNTNVCDIQIMLVT